MHILIDDGVTVSSSLNGSDTLFLTSSLVKSAIVRVRSSRLGQVLTQADTNEVAEPHRRDGKDRHCDGAIGHTGGLDRACAPAGCVAVAILAVAPVRLGNLVVSAWVRT